MIILAGGLGFIGSNIAIELLKLNYEVLILDNLSNSDISALHNMHKLCDSYAIDKTKLRFEQIDLTNYEKTHQIFADSFSFAQSESSNICRFIFICAVRIHQRQP